ncbi:MAG: glycerophosphodiester phosphodiesterase [Bacteroidetes bacterium]|nr:glycerophosphodiester phosphodiesterase [Bacteroidota bacterium]
MAFKEAIKAGANYIELDVVISKDSQVVVSHEPWFNSKTCTNPTGKKVKRRNKQNIYHLTYSEIKKYDCGKRGNEKFPEQIKVAAYKPLLSEVIEEMEAYAKANNLPPVHYNIEIKNNRMGDRKYHPAPQVFTSLVYNVIKQYSINERVIIQSFDTRCLALVHKIDPSIKTGLLIANLRSVNHNLKKLGFIPSYYNPAMKICKTKTIKNAHAKGCKVAVWTVNSESDMKRMIKMGANGIITDHPDIAVKLK